jgi:hypothetical protein
VHLVPVFTVLIEEHFHVRVLGRLPQLNVHQFDLALHAPRQEMRAGRFRPIVAADRRGLPALAFFVFSCVEKFDMTVCCYWALIRAAKALCLPPRVVWKAPAVVGKLREPITPAA